MNSPLANLPNFLFALFNIGLALNMLGSVVRRHVEMQLVRKKPDEYIPQIKSREVPRPAFLAMCIFKVPAYLLLVTSIYFAHFRHQGFAVYYTMVLVAMIGTPFEIGPKKDYSPMSNLQTLADRINWLRWTVLLAPLPAYFVDTCTRDELSLVMYVAPLMTVLAEYFIFHPTERKFWKDVGIDFQTGIDESPNSDHEAFLEAKVGSDKPPIDPHENQTTQLMVQKS